ncbi:PEP-CTERM sorting domain-containing protein [Rhodocyclus tenuis]|uniref:Ice-binding protein C-terminal domain-containing protein n=1 Tax=Rhodocyclus tenuis TaxID=1066 RepID=A0A840G912_RHOTE|nr:PEP-CTERM sorting domain-containing protein [Rhodocyclus tenuis]MBB4248336.1 hypothetical protein [Rhodocyclus tenuis]
MRFGVAALITALGLALVAPAQAFEKTAHADGSFEYFFAGQSLTISGPGSLDLSGLNFIEGVDNGFRVGALFMLDSLGGELAVDSSGNRWSSLDLAPRRLDISAAGDLDLGTARLSLPGGTMLLTAGGVMNLAGASFAAGGAATGGALGSIILGETLPIRPGTLPGGGGTLQLDPGGNITLVGTAPVPEPATSTMLLAGMLLLTGLARRRTR